MSAAILLNDYENAVVIHGDYSQLTRGMKWHFPRVESRMLFWCLSGNGRTWINGEEYELTPGRFFILPWGSDHAYEAITALGVGGVHVIPWYDPAAAFDIEIAHSPSSKLAGDPARRDVACPGLDKTFVGQLEQHPVLGRQAEYIVSWFKSGAREEAIARALGPAVLWQWIASATAADLRGLPPELVVVINYVQGADKANPTLDELVRVSEVSKSTLIRQFSKYLNMTPHQWIGSRQQDRAEHLLRTTGLRIKEIAQSCGMDDPLYFSRWFRRRLGLSPKAYRDHHRDITQSVPMSGHRPC